MLIVNSFRPHNFSSLIAEKVKEREVNVIKKKELEFKALPVFVHIFKNTNYISCKQILLLNIFQTGQKGKIAYLLTKV